MNRFFTSVSIFAFSVLSAMTQNIAIHDEIAPLLTCQWGQDAPYNSLCPTNCPTGCTATATAQIMYYYKYPTQGTGSITYTTSDMKTYSTDFSKSTYNWDAMLDKVKTTSSADAKSAVALLMKDVGYGTEMKYQASESVGYLYRAGFALGTYFSYDKGVCYNMRRMYSDTEWDELIYGELEAGRPVVYSGYSKDGNSGHTFVCDGYKDGKYHFNFGWDGQYDGYYTLDQIMNYNNLQEALTGIQPDKVTAYFPTVLYNFDDFTTESTSYTKSGNVKFIGKFTNRSLEEKTFRYGVEFVKNGTSTFVESTKDNTRVPLSYYSNYQVEISKFPTATGTYTVFPAYRDEQGEWHRMRTDKDMVGYVTCKIAFSKITFTAGTVDVDEIHVNELANPQIAKVGIYSLDGKRLNAIPEHGFYILNGKKMVK